MRCPVCKADNAEGPLCRRCRADLKLLFALEEQRQRSLEATRQCLAEGQWSQAIHQAEAADWMITAARTRPVRIAPRMAVTAHALNSIAPSAVDAIMKRQRVQPGA